MRLEEDKVAVVSACVGVKEVIEAGLKDLGGGGVARNMAAEFAIGLVRANDHGERVPPDDGRDPLLHRDIAGKRRLPFERDGIAVRQVGSEIRSDAELLGLAVEGRQKELGPVLSRSADNRTQAQPAIRPSHPDRCLQGGLLARLLRSSWEADQISTALPQIKARRTADGAKDGLIWQENQLKMLPDLASKA